MKLKPSHKPTPTGPGSSEFGKSRTQNEWIQTVLKRGTIADKLAAHTLLIHETKNWSSLNQLIDLVDTKKCRRLCVMAMTTLKDLFLESLNLGRKSCQLTDEIDRQKVRFYFTKFVDRLDQVAHDQIEETRRKALWVLSELLNKHSENKSYIIEKLVNKIGDKVPKLASTAGHFIERAVNSEKPEVREKAIKHIQRFLKKPDNSLKARYYAISLLTRIKLFRGQHQLANQLIETYLQLYTTLTQERKVESKLMSAILVGIHRAYPYSKLGNDTFEQHLQTLYTLVHHVNFRMSVVAMVLIKNIVSKQAQLTRQPIEDRFYKLMFGQLLRRDLHTCSRQDTFVNLVLGVVNEDTNLDRREQFVKRLLQVAVSSRPDLALLIVNAVAKIKGLNTSLGGAVHELLLLRQYFDPAVAQVIESILNSKSSW